MNYNKKALEDLYNQVAGKPVAPRKHLSVFGEDVDLYTKTHDEYEHIGNVSDENFAKINRIATGGEALEVIKKYLNIKGYDRDSFRNEYDYDSLVDILDRGEFENYVESDKKPALSMGQVGNVVNLVTSGGFNEYTAKRAAVFTPIDEGGSNVGPCEVLLALAFKNVTNSTQGGDLMMGDKKLEVKGQGGRFGQQGSRGGPGVSFGILIDGLDQANISMMKPSLEVNIIGAYQAFRQINQEDKFISNLHKLLELIYPGGDVAKFFNKETNFMDSYKRGKVGPIRKQLAKLNLQQYATKYDLQNIIFVKGMPTKKPTFGVVGDFASFTVEDAIRSGGLIDQGLLYATAFTKSSLYPNFEYRGFSGKS